MAEEIVIKINEILKLLPHKFPFLLVDKVIVIDEKRAKGIKNVTINEDFFNGHFPGNPVMPGVLMIEAMAQVGGVFMLRRPELQGKDVLFVAINNVKFRKVVIPGDQLLTEIELTRWGGKISVMKAKGSVDGETVVEAEMTCAIMDKKPA